MPPKRASQKSNSGKRPFSDPFSSSGSPDSVPNRGVSGAPAPAPTFENATTKGSAQSESYDESSPKRRGSGVSQAPSSDDEREEDLACDVPVAAMLDSDSSDTNPRISLSPPSSALPVFDFSRPAAATSPEPSPTQGKSTTPGERSTRSPTLFEDTLAPNKEHLAPRAPSSQSSSHSDSNETGEEEEEEEDSDEQHHRRLEETETASAIASIAMLQSQAGTVAGKDVYCSDDEKDGMERNMSGDEMLDDDGPFSEDSGAFAATFGDQLIKMIQFADSDSDGKVSLRELEKLLHYMGFSPEELNALFPELHDPLQTKDIIMTNEEAFHRLGSRLNVELSRKASVERVLKVADRLDRTQAQEVGASRAMVDLRLQTVLKNARREWADNWVKRIWDMFHLVTIAYFFVLVLYYNVYHLEREGPGFFYSFYAVHIFWLCDIILSTQLATMRGEDERLKLEPKKIVAERKAQLFLDTLCVLPIDMIMWHLDYFYPLLVFRILKLAKIGRVFYLFEVVNLDIITPGIVVFFFQIKPVLALMFWSVIFVHSCTIIFALSHDSDYIDSLVLVLAMLTGAGPGVDLSTDTDQAVGFFLIVSQVILQAIVIGKLSVFVFRNDVSALNLQTMRDTLAIVEHYKIPSESQREILSYQMHALNDDVSRHMANLTTLPVQMQRDIVVYIKVDAVNKVKLFAGAPQDCKLLLAEKLVRIVVEPDVDIVGIGDVGEEMYMIGHGYAEVIIVTGATVATLTRGDYFGEIALLAPTCTRQATVRALTYCDLWALGKEDFLLAIRKFPALFEAMKDDLIAKKIDLDFLAQHAKRQSVVDTTLMTVGEAFGPQLNSHTSLLSDDSSRHSSQVSHPHEDVQAEKVGFNPEVELAPPTLFKTGDRDAIANVGSEVRFDLEEHDETARLFSVSAESPRHAALTPQQLMEDLQNLSAVSSSGAPTPRIAQKTEIFAPDQAEKGSSKSSTPRGGAASKSGGGGVGGSLPPMQREKYFDEARKQSAQVSPRHAKLSLDPDKSTSLSLEDRAALKLRHLIAGWDEDEERRASSVPDVMKPRPATKDGTGKLKSPFAHHAVTGKTVKTKDKEQFHLTSPLEDDRTRLPSWNPESANTSDTSGGGGTAPSTSNMYHLSAQRNDSLMSKDSSKSSDKAVPTQIVVGSPGDGTEEFGSVIPGFTRFVQARPSPVHTNLTSPRASTAAETGSVSPENQLVRRLSMRQQQQQQRRVSINTGGTTPTATAFPAPSRQSSFADRHSSIATEDPGWMMFSSNASTPLLPNPNNQPGFGGPFMRTLKDVAPVVVMRKQGAGKSPLSPTTGGSNTSFLGDSNTSPALTNALVRFRRTPQVTELTPPTGHHPAQPRYSLIPGKPSFHGMEDLQEHRLGANRRHSSTRRASSIVDPNRVEERIEQLSRAVSESHSALRELYGEVESIEQAIASFLNSS